MKPTLAKYADPDSMTALEMSAKERLSPTLVRQARMPTCVRFLQEVDMGFGQITGSGLGDYVSSLLTQAQAQAGTTGSSATSAPSKAATAAAASALDMVSHTYKSTSAQATLAKAQTQLTSDLRAALTKAGTSLTSDVSFSIDATGAVQVSGNKADEASIASFMKADKSSPSFASRLTGMLQSADSLSTSLQHNAALVQAARSAGRGGDVLDLYTSLLEGQSASSATYAFGSNSASLTYPGVLTTRA
jgi:hypothetical protein